MTPRFIGHFWVRQGVERFDGRVVTRFFVPQPLEKEHPFERVFCHALLMNREACDAALQELSTPDLVDFLAAEIDEAHMEPILYERFLKLQLGARCKELKLTDGKDLLQWISTNARRRMADYDHMDGQFMQLLDWLKEHQDSVVWLKGVVTSRTLYERPYHRPSRDFDLVVRPGKHDAVFECLRAKGYALSWFDTIQSRSQPLVSPAFAMMGPSAESEFTNEIQATKSGFSLIEIKFDPLKSGLRMLELDRFFRQSHTVEWSGKKFLAPSIVDHLVLELFNMHRRGFRPWPWLYDIHLLSSRLTEDQWREFVRQCCVEGVRTSAWAGLQLAQDRLKTPVPEFVLKELSPENCGFFGRLLTFVVGSRFVWNEKGLGELILNSLLLGDSARKCSVIFRSFFPSRDFLSAYYWQRRDISFLQYIVAILVHWAVLIVPRSKITRAVGKALRKRSLADATGARISEREI